MYVGKLPHIAVLAVHNPTAWCLFKVRWSVDAVRAGDVSTTAAAAPASVSFSASPPRVTVGFQTPGTSHAQETTPTAKPAAAQSGPWGRPLTQQFLDHQTPSTPFDPSMDQGAPLARIQTPPLPRRQGGFVPKTPVGTEPLQAEGSRAWPSARAASSASPDPMQSLPMASGSTPGSSGPGKKSSKSAPRKGGLSLFLAGERLHDWGFILPTFILLTSITSAWIYNAGGLHYRAQCTHSFRKLNFASHVARSHYQVHTCNSTSSYRP